MALFDEIQFPPEISVGAMQGPIFSTIIVATANPGEQRVGLWKTGRMMFDVSKSIQTPAEMRAVVAFFRARQGRLRGFRFKDWTEYMCTTEILANPYPLLITQLQKTYSSGGVDSVRRITKPVIGAVTIFDNGSPLTVTTHYTVDYTTGVVTFAGGKPIAGHVYTWTGEFDVPVRFDTDQLKFTAEDVSIHHWEGIPIVEVPL
jgi:uncharacterized protein (TIGR02217 family)